MVEELSFRDFSCAEVGDVHGLAVFPVSIGKAAFGKLLFDIRNCYFH